MFKIIKSLDKELEEKLFPLSEMSRTSGYGFKSTSTIIKREEIGFLHQIIRIWNSVLQRLMEADLIMTFT